MVPVSRRNPARQASDTLDFRPGTETLSIARKYLHPYLQRGGQSTLPGFLFLSPRIFTNFHEL